MKHTESFHDLGLTQESLSAITEMGFTKASPIQAAAIPQLLKGQDLIGQAQTGTGKTAAFGIPLIESIHPNEENLKGLVLCPTRELALQVSKELQRICGTRRHIRVLAVFGGDSIQKQIKAIREGVHIIVGTPGRLMDLMERKILKLDTVRTAIMDEADEMLNMGFRDDMEEILSQIPSERQTVLFSATLSNPILEIANRYLNKPAHVKVTGPEVTNSMIEQAYYEVGTHDKARLVASLVRHFGMKSAMVFCNTKKAADETVIALRRAGLKSDVIHGDLNQSQRNQVLTAFRNGFLGILVATDVAARGIDVSNVDAVFNYDIPADREGYVHRIGRTGRAGKTGKAISFVSNASDLRKIRGIEKFSKVKMISAKPPTAKDIRKSYIEQIRENTARIAGDDAYKHHRKLVDELEKEGISLGDVLAYYLKDACPLETVDTIPSVPEPSYEGNNRKRSYGDRGGRGGGSSFGGRSGSGGSATSGGSGNSGSGGNRFSRTKRDYGTGSTATKSSTGSSGASGNFARPKSAKKKIAKKNWN